MPFLFLLELQGLLPLLLHILPLAHGALDAQRRNTDTNCILQSGFVFFSAGLFGRDVALGQGFVSLVSLLHAGVDVVGSMDCGDAGQTSRDQLASPRLSPRAFIFGILLDLSTHLLLHMVAVHHCGLHDDSSHHRRKLMSDACPYR